MAESIQEKGKLHWVVASYFNEAETAAFVTALSGQQDVSISVHVVNNGAHDAGALRGMAAGAGVKIHDPGQNTGYIGALLIVLRKILSEVKDEDLILLTNTDMSLKSPSFARELVSLKPAYDAAMFAPSVISLRTGRDQNPFARERLAPQKVKFLVRVFRHHASYLMYQTLSIMKNRLLKMADENNSGKKTEKVYALHGSFLVFTKKFCTIILEQEKIFPFLFTEELFLAELARRNGMPVLHVPSLQVTHDEHSVTGLYKSGNNSRHLYEALNRFYKTFYSG